jgi:hypothetical protein
MMRRATLALLLMVSFPAAGQEIARDNPTPTIVVTGVRIQSLRDRLAACIARGCPPNEEIDAALALAEAIFESGDFEQARIAVAQSLDRNRRHARQYPEPVADLYRAQTRVARHLGRDEEAVRSSYAILRTLTQGIPGEDERHFTARLEIAEMLYNQASTSPTEYRLRQARRELGVLARRAAQSGRPAVAAYAELRATWMGYLIAPHGPAFEELSAMAENPRPEGRTLATGAKILLARIHRDRGETGRSDTLIAEVARTLAGRRNLIFSPPYELHASPGLTGMTANAQFEDQWIDVGFWIDANGRVRDLEIVRFHGTPDWSRPLMGSIRGRIYSTNADGTPTYRLERYSYTAGRGESTGTRLSTRVGHPRVEYYDLSAGEPPPSSQSN